MKLSVSVTISIIIVAISCSAQPNYQPIPDPPGRYEITHASIDGSAGSLDQLIQMSDLIIEGKVNEVLPAVHLDADYPKSLETYSRIFVNKVIRGELPEDQKIVAISEPGGNSSDGYEVVYRNYPLVKSGERYILFLRTYRGQKGRNNNPGIPIYIAVGWIGKARVTDKEMVQFLPAAATALHSFDSLNVEKFITAIKERINILYRQLPPFPPGRPEPFPPGAPRFPIGQPRP